MHFLCSSPAEKMYRVIEIDIQYRSIICCQLSSLLYIFALPYALLAWSLKYYKGIYPPSTLLASFFPFLGFFFLFHDTQRLQWILKWS